RLHLVEDQQEVVLVAQLAQFLEERPPRRADAALALDRLDQDRGGLIADRRLDLGDVAERHRIEPGQLRPEALEILVLAAGGDGREGAPVEGALEGDDAVALALAARVMEPARHLGRAFPRLGGRVAAERGRGGGGRAPAAGQVLRRPYAA